MNHHVATIVLFGALVALQWCTVCHATDPYPIFWDVYGTGNDSQIATQYRGVHRENETETGNPCTTAGCEPWTQGLWPTIDTVKGIYNNGGVPQASNLTAHLQRIRDTIDNWIPDPQWSGNGVLDFEAWTTVWELNTGNDPQDELGWHDTRYRNYSMQLVQKAHPTWSEDQIEAAAKEAFETAATNFFVSTLQLLHSLRPNARFGFYGFPQGFLSPCTVSPDGQTAKCGYDDPVKGPTLQSYVEKQMPIYKASGALFPSIYVYEGYNATLLEGYVASVVSESVRIRSQLNATLTQPIYPFQMAVFHATTTFVTPETLYIGLVSPYEYGADGMVLWWSHNAAESVGGERHPPVPLRTNMRSLPHTDSFAPWITGLFGPMVQRTHDHAVECQWLRCASRAMRCASLVTESPVCVPIVA